MAIDLQSSPEPAVRFKTGIHYIRSQEQLLK